MSTVSTTVNVNDCCPVTPGTFSVRVHYTEVDAGHLFGTFTSREAAEKCLLILAGRADVVFATIEGVA